MPQLQYTAYQSATKDTDPKSKEVILFNTKNNDISNRDKLIRKVIWE